MSINYVVATYAGKKGSLCRDKLTKVYPHPESYLKIHLDKISKLKHNLAQITIMKSKIESGVDYYKNYYNNINTSKYTVIDCPNIGLSYGQYLHAYMYDQKYKRNFDYYCFIEDDYTAVADHFDQILINLYKNCFPSGIGFLCSWAGGSPYHAAFEFGLISGKTMEQLFKKHPTPIEKLKGLTHGNVQLRYSNLFLEAGIKIKDFSDEYPTPYFKGVHQQLVNCSKNPRIKFPLFIPLQMIDDYSSTTVSRLPLYKGLKRP